MRDDSDTSPAETDQGPGIGERLKHARESRGLTLDAAARDLHVDQRVLRALENEDFDALGAPVFAKGHMRKYGVLLELSVDDLLLDYYTKHEPKEPPLLTTDFIQIARTEKKGQRFAVAFAIIALFALAVLVAWLYKKTDVAEPALVSSGQLVTPVTVPVSAPRTRPASAGTDDRAASGSVPLALPDQRPVRPDMTGNQTGEPGAEQTGLIQNQAQIPVQNTQINDATISAPDNNAVATGFVTEPVAPPITVVFEFEQDSWIELYDANRQRLVYALGRATSQRSVSAEPPIQVFLGNAAGVTLTVDGQPYEIRSRDMRGQTARFTLGTP